jgi:hypothetical protein
VQITIEEVEAHRPDVLLPPDPEFAELYAIAVDAGRELAARSTVAMVAICRNAMPWLPQTLDLVERTGAMFRESACFIFENDSEDGTKDLLKAWADHDRRKVSLNINHRPHLCGEKSAARTDALAAYRTECQRWVTSREPVDYVIVFDSDAWGGWSVDGVATSLYWLDRTPAAAAMASYSWCEMNTSVGPFPAHYDAWAARLNHWRERDHGWFHHWHPAVGSMPVRFNSAFGQLAVYRHDCYVRGQYAGGDCEHVLMHRSMGGPVFLNPSSRCVSFWVPNNGGRHKPD